MENGAGVPKGAPATATETPAAPVAAVREQDRLIPIANVIRIMLHVLPPHAKISDEAKELIQESCRSSSASSRAEANERCHTEQRKTITAEDVLCAMDRLGFDDYVMPLTALLQRMRASEAGGDCRAPAATRTVPTVPGHGLQVQMQRAVYSAPAPAPAPAPVHGYAVQMAPVVHATVVSPRVVGGQGQYDVFGRERAVVQYYRAAAYGKGSSRGGCGDDESSSNSAPVPATGTGLPDPQ